MADGWGGKRRGSGRKPKLTTEIRELALEQAGGDAEYALGLVVNIMRDEDQPIDRRMAASLVVMDRVWGKPTQREEVSGPDGADIRVEYVNDWRVHHNG